MKETGELLKAKRMEKDLSLRQVSEALKISVRVLQAIEEDDPKYLPPRVFLRGFVQSYAAYLQIDVDQILECFQRDEAQSQAALNPTPPPPTPEGDETPEASPAAPVAPQPEPPKKTKKKRAVWAMDYRKWSFASKAFAFLIVAILVALILFVAQMVEKYEKESIVEHKKEIEVPPISHDQDINTVDALDDEEEMAPEEEDLAETEVTAADETTQAPETQDSETEIVAEAPQKEEPKETKPEEPAEETKPAEKPKPEQPKKEEPAAEESTPEKPAVKEPVEEKPKEQKVTESTTPPPEKPPVSSGSQEVIIEAFDNVELSYTLDGEKKKSVNLKPGDLHTLKADSKIQVQINNGGAVNVFHNGKDRGVPGKIGQSLDMTFP